MSNYIPHYTKKRQSLSKKEEHLRRLISQEATKEKLMDVAKEVLQARIRVLVAEKATIPPNYSNQDNRIAHIDAKLAALQGTTEAEILVEFGHILSPISASDHIVDTRRH